MNENPTNAQEQYELGKRYKEGDGVPKDLKKAIYWFIKAYEQGHPDGQYEFVIAYQNYGNESYQYQPGWLPMIDSVGGFQKLEELLFAAAEHGSLDAQLHLGDRFYYGGHGWPFVKQSYEHAAGWYTLAAERGHVKAQINLGNLYSSVPGFPKDLEKANQWYTKAAEQGDSEGQLKLGINYYYGNGIEQDLEKAKHWISLAAEKGNESAKKALANLNEGKPPKKNPKCYIATCVYGSYDCPEVWTLRRYRDNDLSASWLGRQFIRIYYTVSPKLVELFGDKKWFSSLWKPVLNKLVNKLQENGVEGSPYSDV